MDVYTKAMAAMFLFVVVCMSAAILVWAVAVLLDVWKKRQEHAFMHAREAGIREVGVRIVQGSHWFSEDVSAWCAIRACGEELRDKFYWDSSQCRERWRELLKEETKETHGL